MMAFFTGLWPALRTEDYTRAVSFRTHFFSGIDYCVRNTGYQTVSCCTSSSGDKTERRRRKKKSGQLVGIIFGAEGLAIFLAINIVK